MSESQPRLNLVSSPHTHSWWTTPRLMWAVTLCLMPALAAGVAFFGPRGLLLVAAAMAGAVGTEVAIDRWRGQASRLADGSALLTGLLLGLVLPPALPLWMAVLGGAVSIALGKAVYGGLGMNIFNPALVGRA